MKVRIKTINLIFAAAAALAAFAAPQAQASSFDLGVSPAVVTGASEAGQEQLFSLQNTAKTVTANTKCQVGTLEGTTEGQTTEEITVTPTYGTGKGESSEAQGCTTGGIKSQVIMNGCKYTITGAGQVEKTAIVDIVGCTSGKQIEINASLGGCSLKIPEQNGRPHIVFTVVSLIPLHIIAHFTLFGLKATQSGGAACPDGAVPETSENLTYSGTFTIKLFKDRGTAQVTRHKHQYTEHLCGEQVNIQAT